MKTILFFVFALALNIYAQEWTKTPASGFVDVAITTKGTLWACGTNGTVWFSNDSGTTWNKTVATGFLRISASDSTLIACGKNGTVWFSNDKGGTWNKTNATGMVDIAIGSNGVAYGCGDNGTIWQTAANNFSQWTKTIATGFQSVSSNGKHLVAVGENGTIWTAPFNASGSLSFTKTQASGFAQISISPKGTVWGCGDNGTIWLSSDNGTNWAKNSATGMISCDASDSLVAAVGKDGSIWIRKN